MGSERIRVDMAHEKLMRLLNYVWLVVVFPATAAISAGFIGHSLTLGFKTFLLIESGVAIASPLLSAIFGRGHTSHRNGGK
jgi:hypothetical protein